MNAQEAWKSEYRRFKKEMRYGWPSTAWQIINYARGYVREAALERKLEASNRRITELNNTIKNQDEIIARIAAGSFRALIQK